MVRKLRRSRKKSGSRPIHLLVTDVKMAKMGGLELSERLLELHPQMKILYMSGYSYDAATHHNLLDVHKEFLQNHLGPLT